MPHVPAGPEGRRAGKQLWVFQTVKLQKAIRESVRAAFSLIFSCSFCLSCAILILIIKLEFTWKEQVIVLWQCHRIKSAISVSLPISTTAKALLPTGFWNRQKRLPCATWKTSCWTTWIWNVNGALPSKHTPLRWYTAQKTVKIMFSILLYFKNSFIFFWWVTISSQFHSAQDSRLPILSLHACSMIMNFSEATATNLIFPDSVSR